MPIIAISLRGVLISQDPWKQAHINWFKTMAKRLDDPSIMDHATDVNYASYIDQIMARAYPNLSGEERKNRAHEIFLDVICTEIEKNPSYVDRGLVEFFLSLKPRYELVLITTNTEKSVKRILASSSLLHVFDRMYSAVEGTDANKQIVFQRFLEENEKPSLYIGAGKEDTIVYCEEQGIPHIFIEEGESTNGVALLTQLQEVLKFRL